MLILKEPLIKTVTVSAGTWSGNTQKVMGLLLHVVVQATTALTTFDFSITDEDDIVIWGREGITDELNEEVYVPLEGVYTLTISNSSTVDDIYKVYLGIDES